jgi:hypothetical protein
VRFTGENAPSGVQILKGVLEHLSELVRSNLEPLAIIDIGCPCVWLPLCPYPFHDTSNGAPTYQLEYAAYVVFPLMFVVVGYFIISQCSSRPMEVPKYFPPATYAGFYQ